MLDRLGFPIPPIPNWRTYLAQNKIFPWRTFSRVVFVQAALVIVTLAASALAARYFYKRQFLFLTELRARELLSLLAKSPKAHCNQARDEQFELGLFRGADELICTSSPTVISEMTREEFDGARSIGFSGGLRKGPDGQERYYAAIAVQPAGSIMQVAFPLASLHESVKFFDTSLGLALVIFTIGLGALALWTGQKLVFPLGRLIVKTQSVLSDTPDPLTQADIVSDSFGEWSDLETNIDNIRRDLEAKARVLATQRVELATMMGAISDAILAVGPDGTPLFYNSRFDVLFLSTRAGQPTPKLWEIFRDPEVLGPFQGALLHGRSESTRTISFSPRGWGKRHFSLSVSPLRRQDESIYGAVGIFHDVTELKSAEQMRIDFVANVSHELRTPLTSIKGYAETLYSDAQAGQPVDAAYLEIIVRNSKRLMALMEDLLDLSAIESSEAIQKMRYSTDELTTRAIRQVEARAEAKHIQIDADYQASSVVADPARVEQVLVNLLDNAVKYVPKGGRVRVSWVQDGRDVCLRVSDNGPGIPPEHHARLFERFYRVDRARSREQGGTGLGLAIVKHIMQRHHGTVSVESRAGEGATFSCRFPDAPKEEDIG